MDVRSPWGKGDDLFEASPMPMMVLDHFGKVIATNQALIALGDFSKTDIATWQKPPLVVESTDGLTRDFFDHVMTQGQPTGVAFLLLSQDRTLEVDYTISTVGEGSDTLHMVTLSDISDSKCLACRIVKSRDKFRRAVDDTAEFLCRLTPQGIVKFGNLGFANLVARDPWDLPGQPISSLLDKPAVDDLMAFLASFKSTLPIRDYRLTLSDGHGLQRHCWLRVRALFNADGRPDLFSISGRDISAQVEAELQAETRDRMLSAVIDHAPTATILWDDHNRIQRHNRAAPSLFGLRERDFRIGTTALGLVEKLIDRGQLDPGDADPRAYEEDLMRRLIRADQGNELELRTGTWIRVEPASLPDGGVVSVYRDITQEKLEAEHLKQAKEKAEIENRAKSLFLHNMSHELRTPLNAVIGFGQMIEQAVVDPNIAPVYKDYAHDIVSSAGHLLEIINDILDISRIESGHYTLTRQMVDLRDVIDECQTLVRSRAKDHAINLVMEDRTPDDSETHLWIDRRAVKQILINLLSNAVKFTNEGGRIAIRLDLAEPSYWDTNVERTSGLCVTVSDTGVGIPKANQEKVFAPFFQVKREDGTYREGTGLGLPLSRQLAELHGGTLELVDSGSTGSIFRLTLPDTAPAEEAEI